MEENLRKDADTIFEESELYHVTSWIDIDRTIKKCENDYGLRFRVVTTDHANLFFEKMKKRNASAPHNGLYMTQVKPINGSNNDARVVIWCWVHRLILVMKSLTTIDSLKFVFDISRDIIGCISSGEINNNLLEFEQNNIGIKQSLSEFITTRWQYMSVVFDLIIKNRICILKTLKRIADSDMISKKKAFGILQRARWCYWWCLCIGMFDSILVLYIVCMYLCMFIVLYGI